MGRQPYPLDSSAILHTASKNRRYTNLFRISVTLMETVDSVLLQKALDRVTPQFPTIAAGIRRGKFCYEAFPAWTPPLVQLDCACLAPMTDETLQNCAMRVLYQDKRISVEIFHALTDGCGGFIFLRALVMEYAALAWGVHDGSGVQGGTLTDD